MKFNRRNCLSILLAFFVCFLFSALASAGTVHGDLGELIVKKINKNKVQLIVRFDNNYVGKCGSSDFRLTRPSWDDIDLLARAVASGRVVDFSYTCSGKINDVTRFYWWK